MNVEASSPQRDVDSEASMARQQRQMEGDSEERRRKAREARRQGKRPSEMGATLGASKQRKEAKRSASHQERLDLKGEGKRDTRSTGRARPGNRDTDPKRTSRWE
jgi:hypothetical protein